MSLARLAALPTAREDVRAPGHKYPLRLRRGCAEDRARALHHVPGGKGKNGVEHCHDSLVEHVSVLVRVDDTQEVSVVFHEDFAFGRVQLSSCTLQRDGRVIMRAALQLMDQVDVCGFLFLFASFPSAPLLVGLCALLPVLCLGKEVLNVCVRLAAVVDDVLKAAERGELAS